MPIEISFDNTEIAFASRSDLDLRRAYLLFRTLGNRNLVECGKYLTQIGFALHLPLSPAIKATLFRQFVGGETIEECRQTIERLADYGIGTILDYSAEGKSSENSFEQTTQELLKIIARAKGDPHIPFAVFKVTGLARYELLEKASQWGGLSASEKEELERVEHRIERICRAAADAETPVFLDAEETWIQPAIDRFALEMMRKFNREKAWVWNTLQIYRWDRLSYLKELHAQAQKEGFYLGLKLVRGAYMEKERARALSKGYPDPIQPDKASTDRDFNAAVSYCLENLDRISLCAGSHNENSNYHLVQWMQKYALPENHAQIWFAQLLGMSDHLSFNLAQAGYNVVKYVPYAPVKDIVPYLIRRAEENTSVAGQVGRELDLITREIKRRREQFAAARD
ncbi:proline dehydrogenase [bacterium (Candidatus Blackallbacteria) CG17_big_fil_post_rev_8_21_14_2_50_48_46]|uniref:Proline dehydrogenase n=1 Tax=bacterium (Candidatus Blackallbacteria) CG17_big_fil_post_rev_8_21_14_2_50_48_46 TaxID=2014261 RepID=A0A2M7G2P8_9BACT|nr:MAG: proline dehydrogenase [bacterium (Candidatus Blackallbacteria) CG18_big_fil_WC_8_21_14_2_50_49_26]PIW16097.1 MAG: proline dehydrogenase [bacterium (Candidatus Blackallbacteria) CG17_big_fil_post_rev_8_21_14_2_50_48_46]PIW50509.1 MAG: proline dehydrogenase [bacterium (Candidatus Blackallbacteria) CG13_big_fil_rev_8_21_14_2_50_49_14]